LLEDEPRLAEDIRAELKEVETAAKRAANLTRQLLVLSRRQMRQVRLLDLNEVLADMVKMLRRVLGEQISLEYGSGGRPLWIEADAGMMEQVVMNLCVNARDAMPKGGRLTISTTQVELEEDYARTNPEARAGRFVGLSVSDTGCGMDDATLKRIFEPFFTTKDVGKGTGLGLATVHGIVKQHQGWIEVETTPGRGSTFRVLLPAALPPGPAQTATPAAPPA
jgi:signal transduction histidine kinase